MQRKSGFVTTDDKFFENKADALRHQFVLDMKDILEQEDICLPDSVMTSLLSLFYYRAASFAQCGVNFYKNINEFSED